MVREPEFEDGLELLLKIYESAPHGKKSVVLLVISSFTELAFFLQASRRNVRLFAEKTARVVHSGGVDEATFSSTDRKLILPDMSAQNNQ